MGALMAVWFRGTPGAGELARTPRPHLKNKHSCGCWYCPRPRSKITSLTGGVSELRCRSPHRVGNRAQLRRYRRVPMVSGAVCGPYGRHAPTTWKPYPRYRTASRSRPTSRTYARWARRSSANPRSRAAIRAIYALLGRVTATVSPAHPRCAGHHLSKSRVGAPRGGVDGPSR